MSKKRSNENEISKKSVKESQSELAEENDLVFEDPFGDEFDEEEEVDPEQMGEDIDDENEEGDDVNMTTEDAEPETKQAPKQVWRPGIDKLEEGEELEYDPSAYIMYHSLRTEWPCLSFDLIKDNLGDNRQRFPLTMFMVTGSQADKVDKNKITLLKLSELHKTHVSQDSDGESEEDENLDEDPTIEHINVNHYGGINRIRNMPQNPGVVATMSDTGYGHIYDLSGLTKSLMNKGITRPTPPTNATTSFKCSSEGYALDWSLSSVGRLITGDNNGKIYVWNPSDNNNNSGKWTVDKTPYSGHTNSIEDLQWSPTESTVFASASSDKTVRIWDTRGRNGPQITYQAHNEDVNVISWNRNVGYLLASGSDDGSFKVWDLRTFGKGNAPLAYFTYHKGPITSIEWAPHDESVITLSSADNQVTVWDLSVEADDDEVNKATLDPALAEFPPQLLFIHQGQYNVKEVHFHPQIPGTIVSTAEDGFNVFKPAITVA